MAESSEHATVRSADAPDTGALARCPECLRAYRIRNFLADNHGCPDCGAILLQVAEVATLEVPEPLGAEPAEPLETGFEFDGYPVGELVGSDDAGTTYRARDRDRGEDVFLKIFHPERARDSFLRLDFLRNARETCRLRHEALQALHRLGRKGRLFYAVLDPVTGKPLDQIVADGGEFLCEPAVDVLHRLADALAFAHAHGVAHRNLHPGRVLLESDGATHLSGMGLFLPVAEDASLAADPAREEPIYIAPEQARAPWVFDPRSDIFALGCLAFHLVSGTPPYVGRRATDLLRQWIASGTPKLERRGLGLPVPLTRLIERMIEIEPDSRPETMDEVLAVLGEIREGKPPVVVAKPYVLAPGEEETLWLSERRAQAGDRGQGAEGRGQHEEQGTGDGRRPARKRKKRNRRVFIPWLSRVVPFRNRRFRVGAFAVVGLTLAAVLYTRLTHAFGLSSEHRIAASASEIEPAGTPFGAESLSREDLRDLERHSDGIELAMADRKYLDAMTSAEKSLAVHPEANPWCGDLWFLRGMAAYRVAKSGAGIRPHEVENFLAISVKSFSRAAATYRRPGARTRYDATLAAGYPFRRDPDFEGDLGYAFTQASQAAEAARSLGPKPSADR